MTKEQLLLVRLLSEKIGIKTAKELEEFKKITNATTNELLLKRLALYVAMGFNYEEAKQHKYIYN